MKQAFTQRYQLTLAFQAPFLSQASGTLSLGTDVAMQRYQGKPAINGSLIRGNIRGALETFVDVVGKDQSQGKKLSTFVRGWFGKPPKEQDGVPSLTNDRSRIAFDLFWKLVDEETKAGQRTRIQLEETGKVKQGALQVIEDCFPVGSKPVQFHGQLSVKFSQDDTQRKAEKINFMRHVKLALESISAMGSLKGIGFGKLESYKLEEVESVPVLLKDDLTGSEQRFEFRFTLDRPFCLGKPRRPDSNRIVSDDVITGNVLKGVIASQFSGQKRWQESLCFDDLSFSHALPAKNDALESISTLPLSLAFYDSETEKSKLIDFAEEAAIDFDSWGKVKQAPIFQPDWKPKHFKLASEKLFGESSGSANAKPSRLLLVRTGMNQQQGVSAESQLFSMECVEPEGFIWSGQIDLSAIKDDSKRQTVLTQLRELFTEGLVGIGKTQAAIKQVELLPIADKLGDDDLASLKTGDSVIITLTTAGRLMRQGFEYDAKPPTARRLYEEYWAGVSGGKLQLNDFYAQQDRRGGEWHHNYFQSEQSYMPEWLSKQGSVFVLTVNDASIVDELREWQRTGLVVANNASGSKPTWEESPYLPEHGFGRVSIAQRNDKTGGGS